MKTIDFYILFLLTLMFTTACTTPQKEVVVKTEVKVITTPDYLLTRCEVTVPPNKVDFMKSTPPKREELLTLYIVDLMKDLEKCNGQIKSISSFQSKEIDNINKVKDKQ